MAESSTNKLQTKCRLRQKVGSESIDWNKTPFKTKLSAGRAVVIKLLEQNGKPMLLSELLNVKDRRNAEYVAFRLNINSCNQQVRKGVQDGYLHLAFKRAHDGCKQWEPHLICSTENYKLPKYWIEPSLANKLLKSNHVVEPTSSMSIL